MDICHYLFTPLPCKTPKLHILQSICFLLCYTNFVFFLCTHVGQTDKLVNLKSIENIIKLNMVRFCMHVCMIGYWQYSSKKLMSLISFPLPKIHSLYSCHFLFHVFKGKRFQFGLMMSLSFLQYKMHKLNINGQLVTKII